MSSIAIGTIVAATDTYYHLNPKDTKIFFRKVINISTYNPETYTFELLNNFDSTLPRVLDIRLDQFAAFPTIDGIKYMSIPQKMPLNCKSVIERWDIDN